MSNNTSTEKMNNLIDELKNIGLDSEMSLNKKELKTLKARIQKENGIKARGLFAWPWLDQLMHNRLALAALGTLFIAITLSAIVLIPRTISQNNAFAVVSTYPNLNTAPHPVQEPLEIVFSKPDIDIEKLKRNIDLEPDAAFTVEFDATDTHKVLILPTDGFEPNMQYKVTILKGQYGKDYELTEDYVYYFLTQSDNSNRLSLETMFWSDSAYNDKHEYNLVVNNYIYEYLKLGDIPGNVDVTIYKTTKDEAYRQLSELGTSLITKQPDDYAYNNSFNLNYDVSEKITTFNVPTTKTEHSWSLTAELPIEDSGIYFVELNAFGKIIKRNFVLINTYGIQSRSLPYEHFVTAQSFKNSETLPSTEIDGYIIKEGEGLKKIVEQTADANGQVHFGDSPEEELDLIVSEYNGEFAISSQHAYLGTYAVDTAEVASYKRRNLNNEYYVITDRKVYRPGETVRYKVIGRENKQDTWTILQKTVIFEASHYAVGGEQKVVSNAHTLNENGEAWAEFVIPNDVNGYLMLNILEPEYEYPVFYDSIDVVSFDKPQYEITVDLDKDMYQNGDNVTATITATQYDGTIARNEKIRVAIGTSYLWYKDAEEYGICQDLNRTYYDYTNQLDYYETKEVMLNESGIAQVTFKADENIVNHVAELEVSATLGDAYGAQSVGAASRLFHPSQFYLKPYMDSSFTEIGKESYLNVEVLDQNCQTVVNKNGSYEIDKITYTEYYQEQVTAFTSGLFTTDNFGKSEIPITFTETSSYRVTTKVQSFNNEVKSQMYVWIYDRNTDVSTYGYGQQNSIAVDLDKEEYNVGDTVTATIFHPGFSGNLWFTINRNAIHENRIIRLDAYQTQVTFEVKEEYVPVATMEIGLFSNNKYYQSEIKFNVNEAYKEVNIDIATDKQNYAPGESVTLTLKTTNLGNPIASNIAVSVVDKSVLDLERDRYYWMDYSLMGTFYNEYYSNLENNNSLKPVNVEYFRGGSGAAGGNPRSNFANTAYWNPNITTDANGNAQVTFTLPDSLTKWGIAVWAVTDDTKVGEDVAYIQSQKDLKVQTFIPDQIMVGESIEVSAKVFNATEAAQNINLIIKVPDTIGVNGNNSIPLSINAGGSQEVKWTIVGKTASIGNKIIIETEGGTAYDGVEYPINVVQQTYNNSQSYSGYGSSDFSFMVNGGYANKVDITVVDSYEKLVKEYTYAPDVEESYYDGATVLLAHNTFKNHVNFVSGGQSTINTYESLLNESAEEVLEWGQGATGGFGYGEPPYDASPFNTMESFAALAHAVNEGETEYKSSADAALNWLKTNARTNDEKAIVLYIQTEYYNKDGANSTFNDLYGNRDSLTDIGLAALTIAAANMNKSSELQTLSDLLINRAITEGNTIHWRAVNYFGIKNDSNALSFYALTKANKLNKAKQSAAWIMSDYDYFFNSMQRMDAFALNKAFIKLADAGDATSKAWSILLDGTVILDQASTFNAAHKASLSDVKSGMHFMKVNSSNGLPFVKINFQERRNEMSNVDSPTLTSQVTLRDPNGTIINSLNEGQYGLIVVEVSANTLVNTINVKTFVPSGLEVIQPQLANSTLPAEILQSGFYNNSVNYGFGYNNGELEMNIYTDYYDETQAYVVVVRARAKGTFTLGPSNIFVQGNSSVGEVLQGVGFTVK